MKKTQNKTHCEISSGSFAIVFQKWKLISGRWHCLEDTTLHTDFTASELKIFCTAYHTSKTEENKNHTCLLKGIEIEI